MAKTKQQKEQIVANLTQKITQAKSIVFVNYQGLKVNDTNQIKRECQQNNIDYVTCKKTLLKIAIKKLKIDFEESKSDILDSEIAGFFSYDDEVAAAKMANKLTKEKEIIKIKGGIMEGKIIDFNNVRALALIPSKDQLYANLVGSLNAPISGFVSVLKGNLRSLVQILNAIREQKA